MMTPRIPIWFDIDGTILHTRAGKTAFQNALFEIYGWEDSFESVVFAGNTDLQVLMDLSLVHAGDEQAGLAKRHAFFDCMAGYLDQGLAADPPETVPGAAELIHELVALPQVLLGLITGNAENCAYIKLKHVNLDMHFSRGGFGDQHHDRNQLAQLAEAQLKASEVELARGWIIGDTPRDIQAAKHIGARSLGVCCHFTAEELKQAGADAVVEELYPKAELMELLIGAE